MKSARFDRSCVDIVAQLVAGRTVENIQSDELVALVSRYPEAATLLEVRSGSLDLVPPFEDDNLQDFGGDQESLRELGMMFETVVSRYGQVQRRSSISALMRERLMELSGKDTGALDSAKDRFRDAVTQMANRLDACVGHWLDQRLWSINLAPELVAHDERHVSAVEVLISDLVRPFWLIRSGASRTHTFRPEELMWLSVAAWMHDWGHVGGPVVPQEYLKKIMSDKDRLASNKFYLTESRDVRHLHGLISQQLLTRTWQGMHGLEEYISLPAGILCAHHQGFTSLGDEGPRLDDQLKALLSEVGLAQERLIPSLRAQFDALRLDALVEDQAENSCVTHFDLEGYQFSEFRRLVALLRVADAADVGRHRASDYGIGRNAFLARCLFRAALMWHDDESSMIDGQKDRRSGAIDVNQIFRQVYVELAKSAGSRGEELDKGDRSDLLEDVLKEIRRVGSGSKLVGRLEDYRSFLQAQTEHFIKHNRVHCVRFVGMPSDRAAHWVFDAVVYPVKEQEAESALEDVANFLRRELDRGKAEAILRDGGYCFRATRLPSWYPYDGRRNVPI